MTLKEAMAYRGENADTLAEKIGIRAGEITKWMRPGRAAAGAVGHGCSSWPWRWTAGCW